MATVADVRWSLLALLLGLAPALASAQLRLSVRAETTLDVMPFQAEEGPHVRVRLVDDQGAPVAGAAVRLVAVGSTGTCPAIRDLRTGADGRAEIVLDPRCAIAAIRASYEGDPLHEGATAAGPVSRVRPEGELRLRLPGGHVLDLDRPTHALEIRAPEGARARGIPIRVEDELARPIAEGRLDADGRLVLPLRSESLGGPGAGRLVVSAEVGGDVAARRAMTPIVRRRNTHLDLEEVADDEAAISLRGRLFDARSGLPRQAVALEVDGRPLGAVETDADGSFHFRSVGRPDARGETFRVQAVYRASQTGRTDARSPSLAIAVERGSRLPDLVFLLPLAIAAAALLRARLSPRRTADSDGPLAEVELAVRRPRQRADRRDLGVRVVGRRDGRPVAGARVDVGRAEVGERLTDADGQVRLEDLPEGRHTVEISALEHARVVFEVVVPHRGEYGAVRVRLTSLRDRALDAFEPVATEVLGDSEGLSRATVRDVAARAEGTDLPADLPSDVERLAFAAPSPEEEEVDALEGRARRFLAKRRADPQAR